MIAQEGNANKYLQSSLRRFNPDLLMHATESFSFAFNYKAVKVRSNDELTMKI